MLESTRIVKDSFAYTNLANLITDLQTGFKGITISNCKGVNIDVSEKDWNDIMNAAFRGLSK